MTLLIAWMLLVLAVGVAYGGIRLCEQGMRRKEDWDEWVRATGDNLAIAGWIFIWVAVLLGIACMIAAVIEIARPVWAGLV